MNDREHDALRIDLGAHALGQLPPDEAARLEEHLDGCASCSAELADLAPVASALGALRPTGAPQDSSPAPADLEDRVLTAVAGSARHERRRALGRQAAVAAVAAAVVLVATLGTQRLLADDGPAVPLEAVQVQVDQPGVRATAGLVNHTWGVEVELHASGFDTGRRYRVAVLGRDGEPHPAGEFVGTGAREMDCHLNSSVLRPDAAGFEVRDATGRVVATSVFG